ncbi:heavy metal translocating P-type ATPase [Zongyangia hominis]|uniref:P-type Cu(+) transporter n=1 Tax=Zongyangia hominis TaxID=2763677 RepID=A0A926IA21_9FIRM|nr:heavy metal translocating P-type ATPase [Zongyangia hominis]MBC8569761.1 copper-translocating P-type ATPase [Zongyangia hominis]
MDEKKIRLQVTGMTCAACAVSSEKAIRRVPGVIEATVNLATNTATVRMRGELKDSEIVRAIEKVGFGATILTDEETGLGAEKSRFRSWEIAVALILGLFTLYIGMSHMLPFPLWLPSIIDAAEHPFNFGLIQLIFTLPILIAGRSFFINGAKNLVRLHPNMDSLVAIGTGSAFLYSLYYLWRIYEGDAHAVHNLYFESAAVVVALVLLGKFLEERSKNQARSAIKSLVSMIPQTAVVIREEGEVEVPAGEVQVGDKVVVKPGGRIPVDAVVLSGEAAVDESMLTGESLPVFKEPESKVSGGTICKDGHLVLRATGVGGDTAISQVLKLVTEAQNRKAPAARLADQISGIFVPAVIVIAVVSAVIWWLVGEDLHFIINVFVSVLVVACPCSLGLATPIAVMAGSGRGASLGILYRGGDVMEAAAKVDTVLFDKTGTITKGELAIHSILPMAGVREEEVMRLTVWAEYGSQHPIAEAVARYAAEHEIQVHPPRNTKTVAGRGIIAEYEDMTITAGTLKLLAGRQIEIREESLPEIPDGCTAIYLARDKEVLGAVALSDTIKEDAAHAVSLLKEMGVETAMITGDNAKAAGLIAKQAGLSRILANVLPGDKAGEVQRLKEQGRRVAMTGDGINDAPALAAADVGISVFGGTDVSAESSGIILMREELTSVVDALSLSRKTLRIIRENLFWAFIYNTIGIPIAAGVLYAFGGPLLSPVFAGAAMALSSVSVVLNSLRLSRFQRVDNQKG